MRAIGNIRRDKADTERRQLKLIRRVMRVDAQ